MDISVSRLNERMALRVPSELPLGLVFIIGQVEAIRPYPQDPNEVSLRLADGDHSLPCRLPQQVADEMQLAGNERVRAGGHLVFDTREARYYLLARDIEVLPPLALARDDAATPPPAAAAATPEPVDEGGLVTAELPPWVRQLAPPEVQSELGLLPPTREEAAPDQDELIPLPTALVEYLSQAIDSEQELELTPTLFHELMERYNVETAAPVAAYGPAEDGESAAAGSVDETEPAQREPAFLADADDDSVPASELPAGATEQPPTRSQKPQEPSPQRQMLMLVGGVLALTVVVLLVFVLIALAAGYTPFLLP